MNVFGIWLNDSDELGILQVLSIKSYIQHKHNFTLYTYKKFSNIPDGCIVKDASKFISEKQMFKECRLGSYTAFVDLLKFKILYEIGGFYTDMDIICLSDDLPESPYFITETDHKQDVCAGVFNIKKHNPIFKNILKYINSTDKVTRYDTKDIISAKLDYKLKNIKPQISDIWSKTRWGSLYKPFLYKYLHENKLDRFINPKYQLFLFDYNNSDKFIDDNISLLDYDISKMWGIHIYNGSKYIHNNSDLMHGIIKELYLKYN